MNNESGFTVTELILALFMLACLIGGIALIWVIVHFIAKLW